MPHKNNERGHRPVVSKGIRVTRPDHRIRPQVLLGQPGADRNGHQQAAHPDQVEQINAIAQCQQQQKVERKHAKRDAEVARLNRIVRSFIVDKGARCPQLRWNDERMVGFGANVYRRGSTRGDLDGRSKVAVGQQPVLHGSRGAHKVTRDHGPVHHLVNIDLHQTGVSDFKNPLGRHRAAVGEFEL